VHTASDRRCLPLIGGNTEIVRVQIHRGGSNNADFQHLLPRLAGSGGLCWRDCPSTLNVGFLPLCILISLERVGSSRLAKMDASAAISPVPSGTYRLVPWTGGDLAKKDAWTVELTVLSTRYATTSDAGAFLQREDVIGTGGPPC
jgi:hypothetical protein